LFKNLGTGWVLVAHGYNPSYSGGKDQEARSLKPAQVNNSGDPISKHLSQKRAGGVAQGVGPEFKPQYRKEKKKSLGLGTGPNPHLFSWAP
jgi:hypothetical protein